MESVARSSFWGTTIKEVVIKKDEHRRHIIPSSLMVSMINAWIDTWTGEKGFEEGKKKNLGDNNFQYLYEQMNNYTYNLLAGAGDVNTAIGMIMHNYGKVSAEMKERFDGWSGTDKEFVQTMYDKMGKLTGFRQDTQKGLLEPLWKQFETQIKGASSYDDSIEAMQSLRDISENAAFDWPYGGAKNYEKWREVFLAFVDIKNKPGNYSPELFFGWIRKFLTLPSVY